MPPLDLSKVSPEELRQKLLEQDYILDDDLAPVLFLALKLGKPLLLEGQTGVGKTSLAVNTSKILGLDLIRLQCYEGLDANAAIYEWNYQKQLLSIKLMEDEESDLQQKTNFIFSRDFLLPRALMQAIEPESAPAVLLIDEIDRADEEFEAFLLELLSDYQITIPELGTIKAKHKPIIFLTSNRTRELSDALRRRCLYHWINYPPKEMEARILQQAMPDVDEKFLGKLVDFMGELRSLELDKTPGVAESLDWAKSILALSNGSEENVLIHSLSALAKTKDDFEAIKEALISKTIRSPI